MHMNKKGQAAMEFLMTYGWAILVVLAAIGALAYFGVLSPDRFLPEKCTMPSGIACLDFSGSANSIDLSIQNAAGFDMESIQISLTDLNGTICTAREFNGTLNNGVKDIFSCDISGLNANGKIKTAIAMIYTNKQTLMNHSKAGELILKIE